MKKILCFVLALIMMLGVVGCGSKVDVEGVWLTNDDDNQCGYEFDSLGKNNAGERGGSVSVLPKRTNYSVIFYNYRIGEDNEIIITESAPSFAGNSVGMDEAEYAYDSTGRIIKVESVEKMLLEETVYTTTSIYTYNEAGALIKMECSKIKDWKDTRLDTYGKSTDSSVEEFFYDDEGCLVSSIYCKYYSNEQKGYIPVINQERERKTITYKTDKKGRVIEEQYETENLTTYKTVYTYGDYYIYSPAK